MFRIRAETDFTRNFRRSSDVVRAYTFVERRLGGVGTMELEFSVPSGFTPELADRLRKLEARLRELPSLTKVLGLVDVIDFFDVGAAGALDRWMSPKVSLASKLWVLDQQRPDLVPMFWNEKEKQMRLMLRAREQASSAAKNELIATVRRIGRGGKRMRRPACVRRMPILNHLVSSGVGPIERCCGAAAVFSSCACARASAGYRGAGSQVGPFSWSGSDGLTRRVNGDTAIMRLGQISWAGILPLARQNAITVPFDEAARAASSRGRHGLRQSGLVVSFTLALSSFITVRFSIWPASP